MEQRSGWRQMAVNGFQSTISASSSQTTPLLAFSRIGRVTAEVNG